VVVLIEKAFLCIDFVFVFRCTLPPTAPEPNTEALPPCTRKTSVKLRVLILEKSDKPLARELRGTPFQSTRVWELEVPLKEGVAKAPYCFIYTDEELLIRLAKSELLPSPNVAVLITSICVPIAWAISLLSISFTSGS
jgi:hypothetical protein